jgi:hypothetical protein
LVRLHDALGELPHTDTHPSYHAHATICYLLPGLGRKYAGRPLVKGATVTVSRLTLCDRQGKESVIPLTAREPAYAGNGNGKGKYGVNIGPSGPANKSLPAHFTGESRDSSGRLYHWQDGHRMAGDHYAGVAEHMRDVTRALAGSHPAIPHAKRSVELAAEAAQSPEKLVRNERRRKEISDAVVQAFYLTHDVNSRPLADVSSEASHHIRRAILHAHAANEYARKLPEHIEGNSVGKSLPPNFTGEAKDATGRLYRWEQGVRKERVQPGVSRQEAGGSGQGLPPANGPLPTGAQPSKEDAKRIMASIQPPERLKEKHDDYFVMDDNTVIVPSEKLRHSRGGRLP